MTGDGTGTSRTDAAARAYATGLRRILGLDGSTVEQAADAALTPGGPTRDELIDRITQRRITAGLMPANTDRAAS